LTVNSIAGGFHDASKKNWFSPSDSIVCSLGGGAEQARGKSAACGEQRNSDARHSEYNTAIHQPTSDNINNTANGDDNAAAHGSSSATEYAGGEPN
jgi:hypothetical protein